jgi:hypothetical protein
MNEAVKYIKAPVRYKNGYFWDANNLMIAHMRGWGWIQYKGDQEKAAAIQDEIGEFIAQAITDKLRKNKNE